MRVIKFRAWDNTPADTGGQTMLSWDKIRELIEHEIFLDAILEGEHESLITMQFTGLTDANGVEIYEGDILGGGDMVSGYVVFQDGAYRINQGHDNTTDSSLVQWRTGRLQVIGDIHQSPELLEGNDV